MTKRIDPMSLLERLATVQVVDVRNPNEWEAGHIEGAIHIPQDYLYERVGELARARPVEVVPELVEVRWRSPA